MGAQGCPGPSLGNPGAVPPGLSISTFWGRCRADPGRGHREPPPRSRSPCGDSAPPPGWPGSVPPAPPGLLPYRSSVPAATGLLPVLAQASGLRSPRQGAFPPNTCPDPGTSSLPLRSCWVRPPVGCPTPHFLSHNIKLFLSPRPGREGGAGPISSPAASPGLELCPVSVGGSLLGHGQRLVPTYRCP